MSFNFDDATNILENPLVRELNANSIKQAFRSRRGLGIVSFQINYHLSGYDVFGYHLFNLSVHLLTSLLVYLFLSLLLKTPVFAGNGKSDDQCIPVPFLAALLFVVHPVQTQAVTYIVQRFTSLAALFYLLAAICYVKGRICQVKSNVSLPSAATGWFALCLAASICAFNSKEIAYTLPIALLLIEYFGFKAGRKKLVAMLSTVIVGLAGIFVKLAMSTASFEKALSAFDAATRLQTITSRSDYLFTQFRVILTYIRLLFLPVKQSVDYDYALSHSFLEPAVIGSFSVLAIIMLMAFRLEKSSRDGNACQRLAAFGIFWFFLALSIESSVLPIIDLVFEHRVYLPSVGAFAAITATGFDLTRRRGQEQFTGKFCLVLLLIAAVFAGTAWKRNLVWQSETTLWEDATRKNPENGRAWNNLGGAYIKENNPDKALRALVRAIELDPSKPSPWNNLGIALDMKGVYRDRFNKTREMFRSAVAVEDQTANRWLGDVNNNLGLAYEIMGNLPKAAENYRNAIGYNPGLTLAYYNLGIVAAAMGDRDKFMEQVQILSLFDPGLAERLRRRVIGR